MMKTKISSRIFFASFFLLLTIIVFLPHPVQAEVYNCKLSIKLKFINIGTALTTEDTINHANPSMNSPELCKDWCVKDRDVSLKITGESVRYTSSQCTFVKFTDPNSLDFGQFTDVPMPAYTPSVGSPDGAAKVDNNHWSCLITYVQPPLPETVRCIDLQAATTSGNAGSTNVDAALRTCYGICDIKGDSRQKTCAFVRTSACNAHGDGLVDNNFKLKEYNLDVGQLQAQSQSLRKLNASSIPDLIGKVITSAMGIMGSIAFALFVYAGIMWMTSSGGDRQAKALKIMVWAALGVIVILLSYVLTDFVLQAIAN